MLWQRLWRESLRSCSGCGLLFMRAAAAPAAAVARRRMTCVRGVQEAADLRQHKQQADTRVQELQASVQAAGARTQQLSAQLAALEGRAAQAAREAEARKGEAAQHGQELEQRAAAAEKRALHLQAQVKAAEDAAKSSADEAAALKSHVQVASLLLSAPERVSYYVLTTWRRGAQAAGDAEGKLQALEADLKAAQAGKVRVACRCWQPVAVSGTAVRLKLAASPRWRQSRSWPQSRPRLQRRAARTSPCSTCSARTRPRWRSRGAAPRRPRTSLPRPGRPPPPHKRCARACARAHAGHGVAPGARRAHGGAGAGGGGPAEGRGARGGRRGGRQGARRLVP